MQPMEKGKKSPVGERQEETAIAAETHLRNGSTRRPPLVPSLRGLLLFISGTSGTTPIPTTTLSAANTLPVVSFTPVTFPSLVLQRRQQEQQKDACSRSKGNRSRRKERQPASSTCLQVSSRKEEEKKKGHKASREEDGATQTRQQQQQQQQQRTGFL